MLYILFLLMCIICIHAGKKAFFKWHDLSSRHLIYRTLREMNHIISRSAGHDDSHIKEKADNATSDRQSSDTTTRLLLPCSIAANVWRVSTHVRVPRSRTQASVYTFKLRTYHFARETFAWRIYRPSCLFGQLFRMIESLFQAYRLVATPTILSRRPLILDAIRSITMRWAGKGWCNAVTFEAS